MRLGLSPAAPVDSRQEVRGSMAAFFHMFGRHSILPAIAGLAYACGPLSPTADFFILALRGAHTKLRTRQDR